MTLDQSVAFPVRLVATCKVPAPVHERLTLPAEKAGGLNVGGAAERLAVHLTAASNNFSPSAFNVANVSPPRKMPVRLAAAVTGAPLIGSGCRAAPFSTPHNVGLPLPSAAVATMGTEAAKSPGVATAIWAAGPVNRVLTPAGNPAASGWGASVMSILVIPATAPPSKAGNAK